MENRWGRPKVALHRELTVFTWVKRIYYLFFLLLLQSTLYVMPPLYNATFGRPQRFSIENWTYNATLTLYIMPPSDRWSTLKMKFKVEFQVKFIIFCAKKEQNVTNKRKKNWTNTAHTYYKAYVLQNMIDNICWVWTWSFPLPKLSYKSVFTLLSLLGPLCTILKLSIYVMYDVLLNSFRFSNRFVYFCKPSM